MATKMVILQIKMWVFQQILSFLAQCLVWFYGFQLSLTDASRLDVEYIKL